jgi:hypothetical protein
MPTSLPMPKRLLRKLIVEQHGGTPDSEGFEFQILAIGILFSLIALLCVPAKNAQVGDQTTVASGCSLSITGDIAFCD